MTRNKIFLRILIGLGIVLYFFLVIVISGIVLGKRTSELGKASLTGLQLSDKDVQRLVKTNQALKKKLSRLEPTGYYLLIDTAQNIIYLKKGGEIIRRCQVSCGSGSVLEEPNGKRKWIFDTPKGAYNVQSKLRDPVWLKPDWAFIEEGKLIPKKMDERIEEGVLGDYALGFGDGFFIHGTLYTRLIGRNVTHGCIRVGDDDLKALFYAANIGTKIFIY